MVNITDDMIVIGRIFFKCLIFCQYYREYSQSKKSMVEHFCKNSEQLLVVNYFLQKSSIIDIQLFSKQALGNMSEVYLELS